jgi:hypothetical protein
VLRLQRYYRLLSTEENQKKYLTKQQLETIFGCLEHIFTLNKECVTKLSTRLYTWPLDIKELFRQWMDIIPLYKLYFANFNRVLTILNEVRAKNKRFVAFLEDIQRDSGSKLVLEDYVMLPLTQLERFQQLMEQLYNALGSTYTDGVIIGNFNYALKEMSKSCKQLFQELSQNKMVPFNQIIEGLPKKINLNEKGRFLLCDGNFEMTWSEQPNLNNYHVFLFNDLLVITTKLSAVLSSRKKFRYERVFLLSTIARPPEENGMTSFTLTFVEKEKKGTANTIKVFCNLKDESQTKARWLEFLTKYSQEGKKRR